MVKNLVRFVDQYHSGVDPDLLKYAAGTVTSDFVVGYYQQGAAETFSIGQPCFDQEGNLLGYLGIGLFGHLNYSSECDLDIPVECYKLFNRTRYCKPGVKVVTYWQNRENGNSPDESYDGQDAEGLS